jgi:hypothetical protein
MTRSWRGLCPAVDCDRLMMMMMMIVNVSDNVVEKKTLKWMSRVGKIK